MWCKETIRRRKAAWCKKTAENLPFPDPQAIVMRLPLKTNGLRCCPGGLSRRARLEMIAGHEKDRRVAPENSGANLRVGLTSNSSQEVEQPAAHPRNKGVVPLRRRTTPRSTTVGDPGSKGREKRPLARRRLDENRRSSPRSGRHQHSQGSQLTCRNSKSSKNTRASVAPFTDRDLARESRNSQMRSRPRIPDHASAQLPQGVSGQTRRASTPPPRRFNSQVCEE